MDDRIYPECIETTPILVQHAHAQFRYHQVKYDIRIPNTKNCKILHEFTGVKKNT